MYHAFIIDDDKFSTEVTYRMFPWAELNITKIDKIHIPLGLVTRILSEKPHIVFIDIEMGDISGLDIIKECKDSGCNSLFIIISGHDNFSYAHRAVNLGAVHYLLKPVTKDDISILTQKLKKLLSNISENNSSESKNEETGKNSYSEVLPNENTNILWKKVLEYIEKNFNKKIHAQSICKELYISERTFYYLFKSNTNESFVEYLTRFRIEKAKHLLLNSNMSISEISENVGIKDHYYFNKIFKKYTGVTPLSYKSERSDSLDV